MIGCDMLQNLPLIVLVPPPRWRLGGDEEREQKLGQLSLLQRHDMKRTERAGDVAQGSRRRAGGPIAAPDRREELWAVAHIITGTLMLAFSIAFFLLVVSS